MPNGRISPRRHGRGKGWTKGNSSGRSVQERQSEAQQRARAAVADERRGSVYRTDVEFTGTDGADPLPPMGPQRDALVERLRKLREAGVLSQTQIAFELGIDSSQVGYLCQRHKIRKGKLP